MTQDSIQPFKIYDMNNLVQDAADAFYKPLLKNLQLSDQNDYAFHLLVNPDAINNDWWIESRKLAEYPKNEPLQRSCS